MSGYGTSRRRRRSRGSLLARPPPAQREFVASKIVSSATTAEVVRRQLSYAWEHTRGVLDGLDEDEYLWEPAEPSWSIRHRATGVRGWGVGEFVCEDAWPAPDPLPATTIAWRVVHLAAWTDVYGDFAFGSGDRRIDHYEVPSTCAGGVASLVEAQDRFRASFEALPDEEALALRPAHWGARLPVVHLVTTMLIEHVHHVAEIGALRDLRRGKARPQPQTAPSGPAWWFGR